MEEDDSQDSQANSEQAAQQAAQLEELRKAREARLAELQARAIVKQVLEPEAYERLANIRAANPALYSQLASLFVYLAQNGRIKSRVSEAQLKEFVSRLLAKQRKETKIVRLSK